MTVVLGLKENDVVFLGADSQASQNVGKATHLKENCSKVFCLDNGIVLAFAGTARIAQAIGGSDIFCLDENGTLTKDHIVKNIVPKLVEFVNEPADDESGRSPVNIIVGYKNCLYYIDDSLWVVKINDYIASGSGARYVYYNMDINKDLPAKQKMLKAMIASAKNIDSVGGPYVIVDTMTNTKEVFDMGGENH